MQLVSNLRPGKTYLENTQAITFFVAAVNTTSMFTSTPYITPTGTLIVGIVPRAEGYVALSFYAKDDGGTMYGGNDTSAMGSTKLQILFAFNTPPTFDVLKRLINVSSETPFASIANVTGNVLPGNPTKFEESQIVHFVVSSDSSLVYNISLSIDGTLQFYVSRSARDLLSIRS